MELLYDLNGLKASIELAMTLPDINELDMEKLKQIYQKVKESGSFTDAATFMLILHKFNELFTSI